MDEFPRRAFCALFATSTGIVSGSRLAGWRPGETRRRHAGETVVTTRSELEDAFDALSPGETVRISAENAPYRTREWLDVDVDGVTVIGPGIQDLIVPADGANVGGIRIGHARQCRDVTVRGVGYSGNADRQRERARRLHGLAVRNATNVTIERNQIEDTHPRRHGDGGSGVSVSHRCSGVRIVGNRVREFGDRGVQVAGERILVAENLVTDGLDRPVACDVWYPDGENRTATNAAVYGNVLGDTDEGSLVGVGSNTPVEENVGWITVFGNVGFGSHKHFCHLRGPGTLRNVAVRNNASVQETAGLETERTTAFAGITVDVEAARNVSVADNELYGYGGHGVTLEGDLSGFAVRNNAIAKPGRAGIHVIGASDGLIGANRIEAPGGPGVDLRETTRVAVRGNYVRDPGLAGIVSGGPDDDDPPGAAANDLAGNYVTGDAPASGRTHPAIVVRDAGVRVRGNALHRDDAPAVVEGERARDNVYEGNWTTVDGRPWRIESATSTVRNNEPPVDVHRGASAPPDGHVVRVDFDRPYARPPRLGFGRTGGGIRERSYVTDEGGDYVGVELAVARAGGTVDVFVDPG